MLYNEEILHNKNVSRVKSCTQVVDRVSQRNILMGERSYIISGMSISIDSRRQVNWLFHELASLDADML